MNTRTWCPVHSALALAFALLCPAAAAQALDDEAAFDTPQPLEAAFGSLERDAGFLVDRTMTNFGAAFVREFAHAWRARTLVEPVDLTITEKPSARWGSLIVVEHRNRPVARLFLLAGRSATIAPLAAETANYLSRRLADNALLDKLFKNPDLAPEELP